MYLYTHIYISQFYFVMCVYTYILICTCVYIYTQYRWTYMKLNCIQMCCIMNVVFIYIMLIRKAQAEHASKQ